MHQLILKFSTLPKLMPAVPANRFSLSLPPLSPSTSVRKQEQAKSHVDLLTTYPPLQALSNQQGYQLPAWNCCWAAAALQQQLLPVEYCCCLANREHKFIIFFNFLSCQYRGFYPLQKKQPRGLQVDDMKWVEFVAKNMNKWSLAGVGFQGIIRWGQWDCS